MRALFKGLSMLNGVHLKVDPMVVIVLQAEDACSLAFTKWQKPLAVMVVRG